MIPKKRNAKPKKIVAMKQSRVVEVLNTAGRTMVRVVVAARTNRVSARLPVIVSGGLNGYLLSGDGRRPPCHQTLLATVALA